MKASLILVAALMVLLPLKGEDISLLDGSRIKGKVLSATRSEVTVQSDLGVLRIALEKLTPESRAKILESSKPDAEALLRRIAELEAKVSQLQTENEQLRRQALSGPGTATRPPTGQGITTTPTKAASGLSYSLSSTGKRHNSNCRYFGSGKTCGPNDGVACKICGG